MRYRHSQEVKKKMPHCKFLMLFWVKNWSEWSACASAYEVAIKLGIISPPPPLSAITSRILIL